MGFDYKWTCPEIDKKIEAFGEHLEYVLEENFSNHKNDFLKDVKVGIETHFISLAEGLRTCNSKLRDEADNQIGYLENKVEEMQEIIKELEARLSDFD